MGNSLTYRKCLCGETYLRGDTYIRRQEARHAHEMTDSHYEFIKAFLEWHESKPRKWNFKYWSLGRGCFDLY
jgi:hypothetical protein